MKKLLFIFIFLNTLILQADVLLYYIAGVLPSVISNSKPIAKIDNSKKIVNKEIYAGQTSYAMAGASDNLGIVYCKWTDYDGNIMVENRILPPMKNMDEYACPFETSALMVAGNFVYKLTVEDTSGNQDSNELNVTVLPNSAPTVDIGSNKEIVVGSLLEIKAIANDADGDKMTYQWMYGIKGGSTMYGAGTSFELSQLFDTVGLYVVTFEAWDIHGVSTLRQIDVNVIENPNVPEQFTFTDEIGVNINQWFSSSIVVKGLSEGNEVDISSSGYPREDYTYFLVNGNSNILKVKNGDIVKVAHLSSNQDATTLNTVITIGGISDTFSTTTKVSDSTKIPLIVGAPKMSGNIHENYSYTPQLSTDYTHFAPATKPFTIENQPTWANFDVNTGKLSGKPTIEGLYRDIKISAYGDDGMDSIVFDITITKDRPPYINGYGHSLENQNMNFTFNDNADWRSKITEVWMSSCYGSEAVLLNQSDYTFAEGSLTLHSSLSSNVVLHIPTMGGGSLSVKSTDYVESMSSIDFIRDGQYAIKANISIYNNGKLNEGNLNSGVLDINLSNYLEFSDDILDVSSFMLGWNTPSSISIDSVNYINSTSAQLFISYTGEDFDNNISLYMDISADELNSCQGISTNSVNVEAIIEVPKYIYPDDPTNNADFGLDIDTYNGTVATIAKNGIYIHKQDSSGVYQQVQKINPPEDNNVSWTSSIAIDGDYLVYGEGDFWAGEDANGLEGKVYIYKIDVNGLYQLHQEVVASGLSTSAHFGASVDISDDLLIVGAYNDDDHKGAAYLYQLNTTSGDFEQKERIVRADGKEVDWFGYDVAIDGDYFVIGMMIFPNAATGDMKEELGSGIVYYYNYLNNTLEFMVELQASDSAELSDLFGSSVSISKDYISVGTYGKGVYLFKRAFDSAIDDSKLTPDDGEEFGKDVAIYYKNTRKYIAVGQSKGFDFVQKNSNLQKSIIETDVADKLAYAVSTDEQFSYYTMPYNEDKNIYHHGAVLVVDHGQSYNLHVEDKVALISGVRELKGADRETAIIFDAQISQINSEVDISIIGGKYSIDGGSTWISSTTPISSSQSIKIRHTSSDDYNSSVSTTLRVGTQSATFTSTTLVEVAEIENVVIVGELMWEDTDHVKGSENSVTWSQAYDYCEKLNLGNYTNWRLAHSTMNSEEGGSEVIDIRVEAVDDSNNTILEEFNPIYQSEFVTTWTDELVDDGWYMAMIFQYFVENGDAFAETEELNVRCVRDIE